MAIEFLDITEAMQRSLAALFAQPYAFSPGVGTPDVLVSGNITIGWQDQRDRLTLPIIEIDAPLEGEAPGRSATVTAQQRVDDNGVASSDLNDEDFLWTVTYGLVDLPLIVRVASDTPHERSKINFAIESMLAGDPNEGGLAESPPNTDYFGQVFTFQQAGTARNSDSTTTAGRDEFVSLREVTGFGCRQFQYISASFKDLSIALKVTEMGRDFDLVPSESIIVFDPTTP